MKSKIDLLKTITRENGATEAEEQTAREMIDAFDAVEGNKYGMYMLDKELATRVYNVPSPLATAAE